MNPTAVVIAAIAAITVLGLAVLFAAGIAREWWRCSVSFGFIPAHKRRPRTTVEVRTLPVLTGAVEPAAEVPVITSAAKRGTG